MSDGADNVRVLAGLRWTEMWVDHVSVSDASCDVSRLYAYIPIRELMCEGERARRVTC